MKRRTAIGGLLGSAALTVVPNLAMAANAVVRLALLPIDTDAVAYYANDLGYFKDAGIDMEIGVIQAGSTVVAAILGGSIDIGFTNVISLASAHMHGIPLVAIAPGGIYAPNNAATAVIMVPKDSPIKTAADFSGKTMACSGLKNLGQWAPAAWIDKNGGDSSKVQFVEMPFPDMPVALASHRVDWAIPAEPFLTESKTVARVFANAYAAIAPQFSIGVWVTTKDWADAHKDIVAKFAQAIGRAAAWGNTHHAESGAILAKYGKFDPSVSQTMLRVKYATRITASDLQPIIDLAAHYGALTSTIPADTLIYKA
jgi:NitT/TauT family transport system substrate-binding protein